MTASTLIMPAGNRPDEIIDAVCRMWNVSRAEVSGPKRSRYVVTPRHVAMALLRRYTDLSQDAVGHLFGGRDHTTVFHASKTVADLCDTDETFAAQVKHLERELLAAGVIEPEEQPAADELLQGVVGTA